MQKLGFQRILKNQLVRHPTMQVGKLALGEEETLGYQTTWMVVTGWAGGGARWLSVVQGPEYQLWGRFQQCLKNQQDSISDIVGVAFFNVLEVPCFVLEEQEACVAWYWWGGYVAAPFNLLPSQRGSPGRDACLYVCPPRNDASSSLSSPQDRARMQTFPGCPIQPSGTRDGTGRNLVSMERNLGLLGGVL